MNYFKKLLPVILFFFSTASTFAQFSWIETTNFKIHYVTAGAHAVNLTDNNHNSIPDYVEQIAISCESVYNIYINQMGFYKPPYDTGGRYNFYVVNFSALIPPLPAKVLAVNIKRDSIGDNPNSPVVELYSATSYVRLRNSYAGLGLPYSPEELLCISIAHEFFHTIQRGYNQHYSNFLGESMATHMTDKICGTNFRVTQHMNRFLDYPELSLNYDRADNPNTQHQYGAWLFYQFVEEHYDSLFVKNLLAACMYKTDKAGEMAAIDNTLMAKGKFLSDVFTDFCIANYLFTDLTGKYPKYTYKDATVYRITTGTEGAHIADSLFYLSNPVVYKNTDHNLQLMRLSSNYHYVESLTPFSITVKYDQNINSIKVVMLKFNVADNKFEIETPAYRQLNGKKEHWMNIENVNDYMHYGVLITRYDRTVTDTNSLGYEIHLNKPDPWTIYDISPYTDGGYASALDIDIDAQTNEVWVTTGGILKFSNHKWSTVRDLVGYGDAYVGAVKDDQNQMWFGYQNAGLIKKDAGGAFTEYTFNNTQDMTPYVTEVAYAGGNTIWKAGDNILKYDGNAVQKWGISEGLPTNDIKDVVVSKNGAVWVTSDKGVGRYLAGGWSWFNSLSGIPNELVFCVDIAPDNAVWIGMGNGHVAKFDGLGFNEILPNPMMLTGCTLPCNITDVKCGTDNKIWFGQYNGGLWMYDGTNWQNYNNVSTGIPEMIQVHKIALEADSCVWIAMKEKVARFCYKNNVTSIAQDKSNHQNEIIIYPNPAQQIMTIDIAENKSIKSITLLNSLGQVVMQQQPSQNQIDVSAVENGLYFLHVETADGMMTKRVVIAH